MPKNILIKSTGAIGDLVILSAVQKQLNNIGCRVGVISKGFTLPLWENLQNVSLYKSDDENLPSVDADISNYLAEFPHTNKLPSAFAGEERFGHLSEWMAYSIYNQIEDEQSKNALKKVSGNDVRICLKEEEIMSGRDKLYELSKENNRKPVVILSPYSNTKNRNLSKNGLEKIVNFLSNDAVLCLLEPFDETQYIEGTIRIGNKDLRMAASYLLAADLLLLVDSGPLHMAMGTIQGTDKKLADKYSINTNPAKVLVALGSSNLHTVSYKGNQTIVSSDVCNFSPCGAHGYVDPEEYGKLFKTKFYPTNKPDKDKSGCVFLSYSNEDAALCMTTLSEEEIVDKIRTRIKLV
jgi:hypothetical protein